MILRKIISPLEDQDNLLDVQPVESPEAIKQRVMQGSPAERSEFTRTVSINVDGYRRALRYMEALLQRVQRTRTPGGMWILGEGGQGKTFILESFLRAHPPLETTYARRCDVLCLTLSSKPSMSEILLQILLALGQKPQFLKYQKIADLQEITEQALVACGVKMICFDEAQHLWLSSSARNSRVRDRYGGALGDFLKRLYDRAGIGYVFSGTQGLKEVMEVDSQVSTRWPGLVELQEFKDDQKFFEVLQTLDAALPMPKSVGLHKPPFRSKLYEASQGNFRRLKSLMAEAVYIASFEGAPKIEYNHLAQAYFQVFCQEITPFGEVYV